MGFKSRECGSKYSNLILALKYICLAQIVWWKNVLPMIKTHFMPGYLHYSIEAMAQ